MINTRCFTLKSALFLVLLMTGFASAAMADTYPGNALTFTSASGNTKPLFNFSGSTMTITGDVSGTNKYYLNGVQLIGIRSVFLTNANGSAPSGITFSTGGGYVAPTSASTSHTSWVTYAPSTYKGFDDGASGRGFSNGSDFLVVGNPTLAGKTAANNKTFGSFTFSSTLLTAAGTPKYYIGLDYLLAGGQSARGYFAAPFQATPTPEAGTLASAGLFALLFARIMLKKRVKANPVTV